MDSIHVVLETTLTAKKEASWPSPSIPWFNIPKN